MVWMSCKIGSICNIWAINISKEEMNGVWIAIESMANPGSVKFVTVNPKHVYLPVVEYVDNVIIICVPMVFAE